MRPTHYFSLIFLFCYTSLFGNDEITSAKVVSVVDGNTIEVINDKNETMTIVLADIDSPELTQAFGNEARNFLQKLLLKKEVVVKLTGRDRKGNNLGVILIKGKTDARIALLQEGYAWTSEKNPDPELELHRTAAQNEGKGLWRDSNPTPPWTYRREQSMLTPKSS